MISARASALLLAAGVAVAPLAARAQTFDMSYSASDSGNGYTVGTTTGTGSFTLTGGNLSAFSLTVTESAGVGETDVFNWGLGDVTYFDATLSGGDVSYLSLLTDLQSGYWTPDQQFADNYSFFAPDDAVTFDFDTGPITIGTLTVTPESVPEPASLVLICVGLAGLVAARAKEGSGSFLKKRTKKLFAV